VSGGGRREGGREGGGISIVKLREQGRETDIGLAR